MSAYIKEVQALHGDSASGAKLTQARIQKAIEHIKHARARATDHDAAEIDDVAAATFEELW